MICVFNKGDTALLSAIFRNSSYIINYFIADPYIKAINIFGYSHSYSLYEHSLRLQWHRIKIVIYILGLFCSCIWKGMIDCIIVRCIHI